MFRRGTRLCRVDRRLVGGGHRAERRELPPVTVAFFFSRRQCPGYLLDSRRERERERVVHVQWCRRVLPQRTAASRAAPDHFEFTWTRCPRRSVRMPNLDYYNTARMHQMVNSFQNILRPLPVRRLLESREMRLSLSTMYRANVRRVFVVAGRRNRATRSRRRNIVHAPGAPAVALEIARRIFLGNRA